MALKNRGLLGIELHEHEVRIVELRTRNGVPTVTAIATFSPHPGYLGEWGVVEPEMLAIQIKNAMQRAGMSANEAAFGLPAWSTTLRALSVPAVAEQELHFIVQGEIEHTQIFRESGASFDLVRLNDGKLLESSGRNILLIGAEWRVLDSVRSVAQLAGLKLTAVEPIHSALYRVAYAQAPTPPNLFVTLSETHSQIWLMDQGQLALHRAFDLGGSIFDVPEPEDGTPAPKFDVDAASTLAVELRRSIDFIARELADAPLTESINLACTHPDAAILAHWLEAALRVQVVLTDVEKVNSEPTLFSNGPEEANRYLAAYALTVRDRASLPSTVPIVDLFANEHVRIGVQEEGRRKFRLALVASFILLGCGAITATLGTVRANEAAADLAKSKKKLADTQAIEKVRADEVAHRVERLQLLTAQGVPVRSLIQAIVRTMPSDVGLVEVKMTPQTLDVSGETMSESSIIRMSDTLRNDPRFVSVSLTWFERVNPNLPNGGERFRMNLQTIPPTPPTPQPVANGTATPGGSS